jgi:hemerythrin-like domain-containing protein
MLKDCHRRIERFLQILCVVVERAHGRAMTQEESAAVQAALNYFQLGGKRHNADEEESLFPRLRAASDDPAELEQVGVLENDHRNAERLHAEIDRLYTAWLQAGRLNAEDEAVLRATAERLQGIYVQHIEIEEKIVFPHAAGRLNKEALAEIGHEFRARRDI